MVALDTVDSAATTTFVSDANVVNAGITAHLPLAKELYDSSSTNFYQDIKTFLAKPVMIRQGNLSTSDSSGTQISGLINLPADIFNVLDLAKDKVRGFLGFRASIKIRIQINANRFQQGRYMLIHYPSCGMNYTISKASDKWASHHSTLTSRTQLCKVELDLACDTEATITIPFVSTMNFFPLIDMASNIYGQYSLLSLWPYSPLVAPSGSTTVSYTIWGSFDDIELIGPAAPQSGRLNFSISKKGKSPSEAEQRSADIGPITSTLLKVSNIASLFSGIPFVSDYATATAWFTERLSNAANVFGWSKPVNLMAANRITHETAPWFCNVDAPDQSLVLGASYKNTVGVMPGFSGTDIDEMDFSFFNTIPCWDSTVSWTTSNVATTEIFSSYVAPLSHVSGRTVSGAIIYDFKPFEFTSSQFSYWRGSMVYKIKMVKTEFHSGRLAFAFFPFDGNFTEPSSSFALSAYVHREIIDVREANEVTFSIPFISSSPWKPSILGSVGESYTGVFKIYVVDPLVAPSTVSSTVTLLIERSAGPDFRLAMPISCAQTPVFGLAPQSGKLSFDKAVSNPSPSTNACEYTSGTLGGAKPADAEGVNELACVGESVTSWRTLLKQFNILPWQAGYPTANLFLNVKPFAIPCIYYDSGAFTYTRPALACDLYGRLASCYGMVRGGVRLKFINAETAVNDKPSATYLYSGVQGSSMTYNYFAANAAVDIYGVATYLKRTSGMQVFHNVKSNKVCEVQVPQYHKYHSRNVGSCMQNELFTTTPSALNCPVGLTHFYGGVSSNSTIARAASEDTNMGVFISVPPMTASTATQIQN